MPRTFLKEYNGFKIGDIITTYHKGFWKLDRIARIELQKFGLQVVTTHIEMRFYYHQVADENLNPLGAENNFCNSVYCKKVDKQFIEDRQKELRDRISAYDEFADIMGIK